MRSEDGSIIQECLNGKPEAFGILVDKYKAGIYAFVYAELRNFHDAQDVTQDVFLQAYRGLRNLRVWENFSFWLFCIARNLCKKWINNKSRRPDKDFIDDQDSRILDAPSLNSHHENQIFQSLQETMDSLPEDYNQVLVLHYFGGMKIKDMAGVLGVSPTAIGKRLSRARAMLKEEMIAMMGTAYEEQRLRSTFTFNIVEIVKRIRIQPTSTIKGLPWGLSFAVGAIITIMAINPALVSFEKVGTPIFSPMPVETKVLKVGEIPVDVIKTSNIAFISNNMGKGKGGEPKQPDMQNTFFMAPQGEGGEWVRKADMPTARTGLTCATVNGKIYTIGGATDWLGQSLSVVEEYDPATDTWTRKADMPNARFKLSSCVANGKIYVMSGFLKRGVGEVGWMPTTAVEEYDPATDTWTKKTPVPTERVPNRVLFSLSTLVELNGKIYVIGGLTSIGGVTLNLMKEYDPVTDKWRTLADMPTPRYAASCIVKDSKIYVIGGSFMQANWNGPSISYPLPTVEVYDPVMDTWTKKDDLPTPQMGTQQFASINGKLYLFGNVKESMTWGQPYKPDKFVSIYDPETNTLTEESDMTSGRLEGCVSVLNGKAYIVGGGTEYTGYPDIAVVLPTVEEYTPEGWSSSISPQGKLPNTWGKLKAK